MSYTVLLYYRFAPVEDPEHFRSEHLRWCEAHGVLGRIYIASEGINGTCAGSPDAMDAYQRWLRAWPGMGPTAFKMDSSEVMPFRHLRVRVRPTLVNLGPGSESIDPAEGGEHLSPQAWRRFLESDTPYLLLDVRNRVEADVGRFRGATPAPYDAFHAFGAWVEALDAPKDEPVLMYCTGGIRCEKFSVLLRKQGYEKVYQLDGGILNYAHEEGGAHFEGDVVVFDDRMTVSIGGEPNPHGRCIWCGTETTRLRNCANMDCHALHLACETCATEEAQCCSKPCQDAPRLRRAAPGATVAAWETAGVTLQPRGRSSQ